MSERRTAVDFAASILRRAILDGTLPAGQRLYQDRLAQDLGVSRMPVREALRQLQSEGLVIVHAHRGVEVSRLSPDEIEEIYEIRLALEGLAVRLAVPKLSGDDIAALETCIQRMDDAADVDQFLRHNREFHARLCAASGRRRLCDMVNRLRDEVGRYLRLYLALVDNEEQAQREHRAILEACRNRSPARAEKLTQEHLAHIASALVRYLREGSEPQPQGESKEHLFDAKARKTQQNGREAP